MAILYRLVFLLVILRIGYGTSRQPECEWRNGERVCVVQSPPQRVLLLSDRLVVGAIDSLYSFSPDLHVLDYSDASPSTARLEQCRVVEVHQASLCQNYIRVVQQLNTSSLLVCGTNAVFPKCRFVSQDNLSEWQYMTEEGRKDVGFSPHSNDTNVAVLVNNGAFFSATFFNFRQTQQTIGLSPSLVNGGRELNIKTPSFTPSWLNKPVFLSVYDVKQHIYFIVREPAYEYESDGGGELEFSRAIRVCKNDTGFHLFPGDGTLTFKTFQKARLRCRKTGGPGSIPYDYNRLQATFLFRPSDGGENILYGAFSSTPNGPQGTALCKYTFTDIESLFDSGVYWVEEDGGWKEENAGSFACPGSNEGQRSDEQARTQQLLTGVVESQPMLTVLGDELLLLAVDRVEYMGSGLEVVVGALKSGEILLMVWYGDSSYKETIRRQENSVTNMMLYINQETQERQILLTTSSTVESLTLGRCSRYTTCLSCLDSNDPYCGWSEEEMKCINSLLSSSTLLDSLTSSEETIIEVCGSRPPNPIPPLSLSCPRNQSTSTSPPDTPSTTAPSSPSTTLTTASNEQVVTPAGLDKKEERKESTGLLAGATVGGFLFGIPVGLVICYLFFAIFVKKGSKPEDTVQNCRPVTNHSQRCDRNDKLQPLTNRSHDNIELNQLVHRNPTSTKNINEQEDHTREEKDVLTPLPFSKGSNNIHHITTLQHQPSQPHHEFQSFSFPNEGTFEKDGCLYSPV